MTPIPPTTAQSPPSAVATAQASRSRYTTPGCSTAASTLIDISRKTGLEFAIDIAPAAHQSNLVTKQMRDSRPAHVHDNVSVVVASNRTA